MHLLWEQPTVTCNNKLLASLGGLIMPPSYFTLSFSNPLESLFVSRNKKGVNLIVKRGKTFRQFLFNGEPKKSDRRKNVCYRVPCLNCSFCYIGETSQWWDEREKQHKRCIKNQDERNSFWVHLKDNPDHVIGWDKVLFMAFDSHYSHRRMKKSFLIDIFAHRGIMNI